MNDHVIEAEFGDGLLAVVWLAGTIRLKLTAPVLDERNLVQWASFIGKLRKDPSIRRTHSQTYLRFREGLEQLIRAALEEAGRTSAKGECRRLAISCNALIDGLWIEGCAMPDEFDRD